MQRLGSVCPSGTLMPAAWPWCEREQNPQLLFAFGMLPGLYVCKGQKVDGCVLSEVPFLGVFSTRGKTTCSESPNGKGNGSRPFRAPQLSEWKNACFLLIIFGTLDLKNPPVRKKAT